MTPAADTSGDDGSIRRPAIYTRTGDDGTTGLLFGGRVRKDAVAPTAYGHVDESQAAIGLARSVLAGADPDLDSVLIGLSRDLWILMSELATAPENRGRLEEGSTKVSRSMIDDLEARIDEFSARFSPPSEFVVPGNDPVSAHLDLARTVVRRAERHALAAVHEDSLVVVYLNRLSDLLWTLARFAEGEALPVRTL
jgi:cob(I)alamin adenosyltransferase